MPTPVDAFAAGMTGDTAARVHYVQLPAGAAAVGRDQGRSVLIEKRERGLASEQLAAQVWTQSLVVLVPHAATTTVKDTIAVATTQR